jgi:hypothetical protein
MKMEIIDSGAAFPGQSGGVEISDAIVFPIQDIEYFRLHTQVFVNLIAQHGGQQQGGI